ncbi:protein translocase subunit SecD [Actinacidiphila bryophytorum]|uniref:Protein translocase subunit SecD n=1 Tax=Actinacidiphila bryophytorum TaxID=1436133 RepID=A0A9W4H6Y4_9ACTN|nr:protein translocase subunit SecD [Actinacidiphila bryophytorum]MBM9439501.1 protein translocase subunit SecD [Actinacidiphila bryophytorum]MBN6547100.1 protein translocase subunit SecD [Actinacidiphila bryophytorum]CAG7655200.1 Protein translocase subunit SecD [Actinacidiphila bryophytorum]
MAAAKKGRRSSGSQGYPGRALAVILIALVAMTGGMFLSGDTTPRLGIDLAGGVSITLTAKPNQGSAVTKANMNTAVNIISNRVNGLGVSEAEVQTEGSKNIIVNIPKGTNAEQAQKQVGTTAQLFFRQVLAVDNGVPAATPTPTPSGSATPSGTPSGTPSSTPTGTATPKSTATPTGSATSTVQNRPVSGALASGVNKAPTPLPTTPPATDPNATNPSTSSGDLSVPADLQAKFTALDCSNDKQRNAITDGSAQDKGKKVIACGQEGGIWQKYVLGPSLIDGKRVSGANAAFDTQQGNGWVVNLNFDSSGAGQFTKVTGDLSSQAEPNNRFAIDLDGVVQSAPSVHSALTGGSAQISGGFKQNEAEDLANVLKYGSLPLAFEPSETTTVSAALGGEQLRGGLIAGAVGLALVVAYMFAYYRGLSFVAIASLMTSAALTYTIMCLLGRAIGFALNLPAVAGAIVAIGITADSFIVFFERIRDELREGRSLQPAVARGWPRARRTILVSDFVSFLAAAVLYVVTVGKVRGFAFTLGLTTVLDVAVVFLFTMPLMTILARRKFFAQGHKWSGLDPKSLGVKAPLRRVRRTHSTETKEA